jgi:hypothetical protein
MRWKLTETNTDWEDLVLLRIAELSHEYLDSIILPHPRLPFDAHVTSIVKLLVKSQQNPTIKNMIKVTKGWRSVVRE